jgi:hypothetical protein
MKLYNDSDLKFYLRGPKKGKEINQNQKVALKCDNCFAQFERVYSKVIGDEHFCKSCSIGESNSKRDPSIHKKMIEKAREKCLGKTLDERVGKEKALEIKQQLSKRNSGELNPNYGGLYSRGFADKPIKGSLEENYGKQKAAEIRNIRSKNASGKNNPMYGKPAPQGSGNGWQGWYKGTYFSSILELSFMVHCENTKIKFFAISSKKEYSIKYIIGETNRTYFPDFLINESTVVEVKPSRLIYTELNSCKIKAAREKLGEHFLVMTEKDIEILSVDTIKKMYYNGEIQFIKRYEKMFKEKFLCS